MGHGTHGVEVKYGSEGTRGGSGRRGAMGGSCYCRVRGSWPREIDNEEREREIVL